MTDDQRDPILDRLREADPTRADDGQEAIVRARVKQRGEEALGPNGSRKRAWRTGLVLAGAGVAAAIVLAVVLLGDGDGLSPGPEPALAIERAPNGVTLTIENPNATDEQMNQELADAGISRVRVFSVPGSPNHAGTWGGTIDFGANCEGAPNHLGYGVRVPSHVIDAPPAPGRDFVHLDLPLATSPNSKQAIFGGLGMQGGAGKRAVVSTRSDESVDAPIVLIAIRPRGEDDAPDAKTFGVDDLAALGGDFARYAQAMQDGHSECDELGFKPPVPLSEQSHAADELMKGGPVSGRCVVKVLGTGLFSIEGDVSDRDAKLIHKCSDRIARAAMRRHDALRERRDQQIQHVDSVADLPKLVQERLDPDRTTPRAPNGGVLPHKRGIDTGAVVVTDYDGHDHRMSPKRPGEYANFFCAARGGKDRTFFATTFFEGKPIANAEVSCRAHGPWRSTHVIQLGKPGIYEIHLNGAGFDDFLIRVRSSHAASGHPNKMKPPHIG
jgi:hypothetical protein